MNYRCITALGYLDLYMYPYTVVNTKTVKKKVHGDKDCVMYSVASFLCPHDMLIRTQV